MAVKLERVVTFTGDFRFLSNFYVLDNPVHDSMRLSYYTVEAAYQASKSLDRKDRLDVKDLAPAKAKLRGKMLSLREDWETVKRAVMLDFVLQKFLHNSDLAYALADTGDAELIEGNHHNDSYWGMVNGNGENHLGKLLMIVRGLLQ